MKNYDVFLQAYLNRNIKRNLQCRVSASIDGARWLALHRTRRPNHSAGHVNLCDH